MNQPPHPPLPGGRRRNTNAVPPLEPPAPVSARLNRSARLRHWVSSRRRELPSWLASMTLHMAVVAFIASLAMPQARRSVMGQLMAVFQPGTDRTEEAPDVEVLDSSEDPGSSGDEGLAADPRPVAVKKDKQKEEQPDPVLRQIERDNGAPAPLMESDRGAKVEVAPADGDAAQSYGPRGPNETVAEAKRLDDIVHQFILYDINELRGAAGQRALRAFEKLGPESIPALVRGLNKSTRYRASCPALVIGRKLNDALARTDDSALIRYAVENIGRDVPADAHHWDVLRALTERWGNERDRLRSDLRTLVAAETDISEELLAYYRSIRNASLPELCERLANTEDSDQRLVALLCLQRQAAAPGAAESHRVVAAEDVIPLLDHDDAKVRQAAQTTLVRLSGGKDFGRTASSWRGYWQGQRTKRIERKASSLLGMARLLQKSGRRDAATRRLREVIRQFPDSAAAREAQRLLIGSASRQ